MVDQRADTDDLPIAVPSYAKPSWLVLRKPEERRERSCGLGAKSTRMFVSKKETSRRCDDV